jgi:hypothetical protein
LKCWHAASPPRLILRVFLYRVGGRVFKCSGYADDTSIAATTDASMQATFDIYAQYERASGAKLNRGKSKGL